MRGYPAEPDGGGFVQSRGMRARAGWKPAAAGVASGSFAAIIRATGGEDRERQVGELACRTLSTWTRSAPSADPLWVIFWALV